MNVFRFFALLLSALTLSLVACEPDTPQPEPEQPTLSFEANISSVGKTTMQFSVIPTDLEAEYFTFVIDKETADEYIKDEYLIATIYQDISDAAAKHGKLFTEYMVEYVDKGIIEDEFTGLVTGTEYYLLVFGVDAANEYAQCSDLCRVEFRTLDVEQSEAGFDVIATVQNNSVTFSVTPEEPTMSWHLFSVTRSMLDQYTEPNGEVGWSNDYFFSMYFQDEINNLLGSGYTQQQVVDALIYNGALELSAKGLNANTEYAYLVAGLLLDEEGLFIITDTTVGYYTTEDAAKTDMTFEINVSNIEQMKASFTIKPSNNNEKYCALVAPWDGVTGAQDMMHQIVDQWGDWMTIMANDKGPVVHDNFSLPAADTDYYIIAFGYDGGITSDACMVTFRTLPGGSPEDGVFEMVGRNATPYGFDLSVSASDPTLYYIPGICTPEQYNEAEVVATEEEIFDYYYAGSRDFNPTITRAEVFDQYYYNGNCQMSVSGIAPDTDYMGYLCIFDTNTGKVVRTITFESVAHTTTLGSITPSIELVGYYSGDEEAGSIFGQPAATKGKAITVVKYDNFDGARTLYTTMVGDDCTSVTAYPDAELWSLTSGLWQKCSIAEPYTFYVAEWEYVQTALCYAVDSNNTPGGIARCYTKASAEEKSPIEELAELYASLTAETSSYLPAKSAVVGTAVHSTMWRPEVVEVKGVEPCATISDKATRQIEPMLLHVDSNAFLPRYVLRTK